MDNIDLRKNIRHYRGFSPHLLLLCAAFIIGAISLALLRENVFARIMSITDDCATIAALACSVLLSGLSVCFVMPAGRVLCVVIAMLGGIVSAFVSYRFANIELFSEAFFVVAALNFIFTFALFYISDRVFAISPKLRVALSSDKKLYTELVRAFAALLLFIIVIVSFSAIMFFILRTGNRSF